MRLTFRIGCNIAIAASFVCLLPYPQFTRPFFFFNHWCDDEGLPGGRKRKKKKERKKEQVLIRG